MMARLGDICTVVSGTTPKSTQAEYWDGDLNWVTPAELTDESDIIYDSQRKITQQAVIDSSLKSFPAGTVLLSSRAPIGKVAIAGTEMYCNQGFKNLICSDKIYNRYLYHFLKDKTDYLNSLGRGATFKEISKSIVENIEIPLPSLEEQRKIAAELDKVSDLIAKRRTQLDKLEDLVKSRFIEMFGTLSHPSQKFKYDILKNLCRKITDGKHGGCTPQLGSGRYFVGAREIFDDSVHYETAPEIAIDEFEKDYKRCNLEIGDLLIVNTGATIGKSAIACDCRTQHTLLQKSVALLKVKSELINPVFLKYCYRVNETMYKVESASAQPNLLLSKINTTSIYVPPMALQNQFAAFVEQTEKSKTTISHSLQKLETLKKALMQEYFG
ncbi:MAG: restriction endonuclease subunit S [Candidatus Treponema excrementipullorum]|uniref:Restriction endonuclease subunit S n=1 Tax=Candidatus Treponema excrementipullorum TaxID=2838768 RepID=A0A9E2L0S9_9SPIR|nr:restriction endonuclease subunit S [Candidatus Treponema excrementipullorum]